MSAQADNVRCQVCRKTPEDIAREDRIRVPSVKYDVQSKRYLCNACWFATDPALDRRRR